MKSRHDPQRKKLLDAMKRRVPVVHNGIRYDRILEYVAWYNENGTLRHSVVLLQGRNSVRVLVDDVTLEEAED